MYPTLPVYLFTLVVVASALLYVARADRDHDGRGPPHAGIYHY